MKSRTTNPLLPVKHNIDKRMQKEQTTPTGLLPLPAVRFSKGNQNYISDHVADEVLLHVEWNDVSNGKHGLDSFWAWPHLPEQLALGRVLLNSAGGQDVVLLEDSMHISRPYYRDYTVSKAGENFYKIHLGALKSRKSNASPVYCAASDLIKAMRLFMYTRSQKQQTDCIHRAAAYCQNTGDILHIAEDVSRHNCLDRLAGWSVMSGNSLQGKVLLTSARVTGHYCEKAIRAGFSVIAGQGAVTSAAIQLAEINNAAVVGFASTNENRLTIFTDPASLVYSN